VISPLYYFSYEKYEPPLAANTSWGSWMALFNPGIQCCKAFCLLSSGPNRAHDGAEWGVWARTSLSFPDSPIEVNRVYDPTNGTISGGDVVRVGGGVPGYWRGSM
jgi:hypothetical protein